MSDLTRPDGVGLYRFERSPPLFIDPIRYKNIKLE